MIHESLNWAEKVRYFQLILSKKLISQKANILLVFFSDCKGNLQTVDNLEPYLIMLWSIFFVIQAHLQQVTYIIKGINDQSSAEDKLLSTKVVSIIDLKEDL